MANTLVELYRQYYPDDKRGDAAIATELSQKYPNAFSDAEAQYTAQQKTIDDALAEANKPGVVDYVKQGVGSAVRGAAETVSGLPKAAATLASMLPLPEVQVGGPDGLKVGLSNQKNADGSLAFAPEDSLTGKLGAAADAVGGKLSPDPVDALKDSFWASKLPSTIGSMGAFMAGGGLGKALVEGSTKAVVEAVAKDATKELLGAVAKDALTKEVEDAAKESALNFANEAVRRHAAVHLAQMVPDAAIGAATQAQAAYDEALAKTGDRTKANQAYLANLPVGAAMALPAGAILGEGTTRLAKAAKGAVTGAGVIAGQQVAGNLIARGIYDPGRDPMSGVFEAGAAGGIVTGALAALFHKLGKTNTNQDAEEAPRQPSGEAGASTEINPAELYRMDDATRAQVTSVVNRELSGDRSPELQAALANIYANPEIHAAYTLEKQRLQSAGKTPEQPVSDVSPAARQPESAAPPIPAPAETPQSTSPPSPVAPTGVVAPADLPTAVTAQQSPAEASLAAARRFATNADETGFAEKQSAPVPVSVAPAPTAVPASDAARLEAARNAAVRFSDRGVVDDNRPAWQITPAEFVTLNSGSLPAEAARRFHQRQVEIAIARGQPVPERVLKAYPGLAERVRSLLQQAQPAPDPKPVEQSSDTPPPGWQQTPAEFVAPGTKAQVERQLQVHRQLVESAVDRGYPIPERVMAAYPELQDRYRASLAQHANSEAMRQQREQPTQPAPAPEPWRALAGQPDGLVGRVDFGSARVTSGERGRGKKSAEAFTETQSQQELYKDSHAGDDRNLSRKMGVFMAPDGSHVLVGTAYENGGNQYVTAFDASGKPKAVRYPNLITSGYRQIAAIKMIEPTKGRAITYSPAQWQRIMEDLRTQKSATRATASAVEEQLRQAGESKKAVQAGNRAEAGAPADSEPVQRGGSTEPVAHAEPMEFGQEHSDAIFGVLAGVDPARLETEFIPAIAKTKRAVKAVEAGVKEVIRATGLDPETALETFKNIIYEAHKSSNSSAEAFGRSLQEGIGAERVEPVGESRPRSGSLGANPEGALQGQRLGGSNTERSGSGANGSESGGGVEAGTDPNAKAQAAATVTPKPTEATPQEDPELVRFSESLKKSSTASSQALRERLASFLQTADSNGIKVDIRQALREGGNWSPAGVVLTFADLTNPSHDNLVLTLHEIAGHPVFNDLSDAQKQMMFRAFDRVANPDGFTPKIADGANTRQVRAEEVLVERSSRALEAEGFDPATAASIAQRVVRLVKEIYLRAALAIQRGLLGADHVSPELAQAFFENRMRQFLAGDPAPMSFLSFIGGPKLTTDQRGGTFNPVGGEGALPGFVNYDRGGLDIRAVDAGTMAGLRFNQAVAEVRFSDRDQEPSLAFVRVTDPHVIARDYNSPSTLAVDVAAYNVLHDAHQAAFRVFEAAGLSKPGYSFEQFLRDFTDADGPATEKIQARNEALEKTAKLGGLSWKPVDPTLRPNDLKSDANKLQAADTGYRYLWGLREHWTQRRRTDETFLRTAGDVLSHNNAGLAELARNYTDMSLQFANSKTELARLHAAFLGDLKNSTEAAHKRGVLTQVIEEMDHRKPDARYAKVIDRMYAKLTGDTTGSFVDILQSIAALKVDWKTISTKDAVDVISMMLAPGDPQLHQLENRALAAITVAFAKSNAHVVEFMNLARSSALGERAKFNTILSDAMGDAKDAIPRARELARKLPKLAVLADRILTKLEELKAENHTPPRVFQDARVTEAWPGAWLEYQTFGRYDTHRLFSHMAAQKAFGRNMDAMRRDLRVGASELSAKADKLRSISQRVIDANPGRKGRALEDAIQKECKAQGESYMALSQAQRNLDMVRSETRQFEALMNSYGGLALEAMPFQELISATAGATVQGPITALVHLPNLTQQFAKLGLGKASLSVLKHSVNSTASEAFGTLFQLFHMQLGWNAERNARRVRAGILDPDALTRFQDRAAALINDPTTATNRASRAAFKVARGMRLMTSTGIGRAEEGAQNVYPTLKPQAPFTQTAAAIDAGLIDGWTHGFEDMIERAVGYFKDPAHAGDLHDPAFRFADMAGLGYSRGFLGLGSDTRAFEYFRNALARYGIDLETQARDVQARRAKGENAPAINDEQFRRLASLVQNEVTLESSVATRPSSFFTNPILRMSSPLIGWSVAKSHDAWESYRAPNMAQTSQNYLKAFGTGMLPYLALVPIGVAMGALRDQMNESLLGKKSNRPDPLTSFNGMVEALGWVGTFGLAGDIASAQVNRDTQRPFDLDHRVFAISSMLSAKRALDGWLAQGTADYSTVYRPLFQALGGSGALQQVQLLNHLLSLDNAEARVTARVNVNNYLRSAGRQLGMDVRANMGSETLPNQIKPFVGQMVLAAYANDPVAFREAFRSATQAARDEKKADPAKYVRESFAADNPLKVVFRTEPTAGDYQKILASLDDEGRSNVSTSLMYFNHYAEQVGARPFAGKVPQNKFLTLSPLDLGAARRRALGSDSLAPSLDEIRRQAAGYGY
jgi:hypothetical protein